MTDRVSIILARRADVFKALSARRRFLAAWILQCVIAGVIVVGGSAGMVQRQFIPLLVLGSGGLLVWSAVEGVRMQRALREPPGVWITTFLGTLFPPAAPVLAIVMLVESVVVLRIARRMRGDQCHLCGYDLKGLNSRICPECGWKME